MSSVACANDQTPVADPVAARLERRLAALEEVREMSLRLTRAFEARILAQDAGAESVTAVAVTTSEHGEDAPTPARKTRDPVAAFATLARAVRLTVMLETRTEEALARWRAGAWGAGAEPAKSTARRQGGRDQERVDVHGIIRKLVYETIDKETLEGDDFGQLVEALLPLYDDEGTFLDDRPAAEVVADLWDEIRLNPDRVNWPWTALWNEANWEMLHPGKTRPADLEPAGRPPPARVRRE